MNEFYMAPMEGITTAVFRRAYHKIFPPADKYFTPFFVPHEKKGFSAREWEELNPEANAGMYVIPQVMTCQADDLIRTAKTLKEYGYREMNLNLGCPSKTVVTKGRGSGFLADPGKLDRFFDAFFEKAEMELSVKTRLGLESPLEFEDILAVYEKYPLKELIIHPRVQTDYYRNKPNLDTFSEAVGDRRHPICYNGDLFCVSDVRMFEQKFPQVKRIMLGRGLLYHPDLIAQLHGEAPGDWNRMKEFHDDLLEGYCRLFSGDRNVLFKMKEFWSYFAVNFADEKKLWKKIRKCEKLSAYEGIVEDAFRQKKTE